MWVFSSTCSFFFFFWTTDPSNKNTDSDQQMEVADKNGVDKCGTHRSHTWSWTATFGVLNNSHTVYAGKLFCTACREELSLKLSIIPNHVKLSKHVLGKEALAKRISRTRYCSSNEKIWSGSASYQRDFTRQATAPRSCLTVTAACDRGSKGTI